MARLIFRLTPISSFLFALIIAGQITAGTDSTARRAGKPLALDSSYRRRTSSHKVIVSAHEQDLQSRILEEGGSVIADYGAFSLMSAPASAAGRITSVRSAGSST